MSKLKQIAILLPTVGIIIFVLLFFKAASLYDGGSDYNVNTKGFSWLHNYWCELLNSVSKNGQANKGKTYALIAMMILSASLSWFMLIIPQLFTVKFKGFVLAQYSGILAFIFGIFIFTSLHDVIIITAALLAIIAFSGIFIGLRKNQYYTLLKVGCLSFALMFINYLVYFSNIMLWFLPVLQKLSMIILLAWIVLVNLEILKNERRISKQ